MFLFLHVFGAIAAVGPTLTYGLWNARAERMDPGTRALVLKSVSWIDNHLATPAFIVQAATGTALFLLLRLRFFHTAWLLTGVAVYIVTAVFAITVYAPVVRKQVALADQVAAHPDDDGLRTAYVGVARRASVMGITAAVLTVAILYFMIVKPTLWSAG